MLEQYTQGASVAPWQRENTAANLPAPTAKTRREIAKGGQNQVKALARNQASADMAADAIEHLHDTTARSMFSIVSVGRAAGIGKELIPAEYGWGLDAAFAAHVGEVNETVQHLGKRFRGNF